MTREELQELINPIEHKLDSVITRVATLIPLAFKSHMEFGECRENLLGKAKAYNMVITHFTVKALKLSSRNKKKGPSLAPSFSWLIKRYENF